MPTPIEVPEMSSAPPSSPPDEPGERPRLPWRMLVPLVTAAAGLMFALSFSSAHGNDLRSDRDLTQLILERNSEVQDKSKVLDQLQHEVDVLAKTSAPADADVAALTSLADKSAASAAATKLRGPGLTVSLRDAKLKGGRLPDGFTADDVVVHQQDVEAVVNALWSAGAEGLMIQDQRVISTSAVRCVGNTLILQGRVYSPPYVITAVGNVDRLHQALDTDPTIAIYKEYVDAVGLGYDVQDHASLDLPAYSAPVDLQYAKAIR